jgi:TonB family protein
MLLLRHFASGASNRVQCERCKSLWRLAFTGIVKINPRTGLVASASMLKSTGHEILDNAALRAFRQWHFKPGMLTTVEIPVEFTAKSVVY